MGEIDIFLVAKQDSSLDHVTEFTDVSGPGVSFQCVKRTWCDSLYDAANTEVDLADEVTGKRW